MSATGGVTFVLLGNLNINSGSRMDINAPSAASFGSVATKYNYGVVAFFKPGSGSININSGAQLTMNGALYAPQASVNFDSGSSVTQCNQVVAYSLTFNSGGKYDYTCSGVDIRPIYESYNTTVVLVQ